MTSTLPTRITAVSVVHRLLPKTWEEPLTTGIDKRAVPGRTRLGKLGLAGDVQCDRKNHGGEYAAVYAYADEDAAVWEAELGREIYPGLFGENLRTSGIDVTGAEIGERWEVGEDGVLLEVTSARTPCRTFSDRMGEPRWVKRFTQRNAPGAYFRVLGGGTVAAGDRITVLHRPGHGITVGDCTAVAQPDKMRTLLKAVADLGLDLDPSLRHRAEKVGARA